MKLNTDRAIDVLIEITPYIAEITSDTELKQIIAKQKKAKQPDELGLFAEMVPLFLKKYRQAVYKLLAVIYEKTAEQIAEQNLSETLAQVKEIANDKELVSFFTSLVGQTPRK